MGIKDPIIWPTEEHARATIRGKIAFQLCPGGFLITTIRDTFVEIHTANYNKIEESLSTAQNA